MALAHAKYIATKPVGKFGPSYFIPDGDELANDIAREADEALQRGWKLVAVTPIIQNMHHNMPSTSTWTSGVVLTFTAG